MATSKPYLIRAIYEWCVDERTTPYLVVQVNEQTRVPREFVQDGQIVLNVSPSATHLFVIGNDEITFQARFSGRSFPVAVPVDAVLAIYAQETGQGMAFDVEAHPPRSHANELDGLVGRASDPVEAEIGLDCSEKRGGHLTRVK